MAEHKIITYFLIMLGINIILFLAQGGVEAVNPDSSFWDNSSSSPASSFLHGDDLKSGLGSNEEDFENTFVTSDSVEETTGNVFTDDIKTSRGWFSNMNKRFKFLGGILSQPYGFLKDVGVPMPIATAFALLWYIVLTLLIVSFIKGGNAD